jgi:hypothetical protein
MQHAKYLSSKLFSFSTEDLNYVYVTELLQKAGLILMLNATDLSFEYCSFKGDKF